MRIRNRSLDFCSARWRSHRRPACAQEPSAFDFYVFTLSWSPGFCDTGGADKSPGQCAVGSGTGFVVHGLWPDNSFGRDPQNCQYGVSIPGDALRLTDGVYPDEGLARYEYLKHGTCTGLDPQAYFAAVKALRDGIVVPDMLKAPRQQLTLAPGDLDQPPSSPPTPICAPTTWRSPAATANSSTCASASPRTSAAFANCPKVSGHTCHASSIAVAPIR